MFKSFLREFVTMKTTSWTSHFDLLDKILGLTGYPGLTKSSNTILFKFSCALGFLIICLLPCFSLLSILTENSRLRFDSILSLAAGIHALTKFLFLWFYKTKREKLSRYVSETTASLITDNQHFKYFGKKYRILSTKILASTLIIYIVGAIAYNTLPLFASDQWKLPLHSPIFGISYQNHPGYEINYFFIVLQFLLVLSCTAAFDIFFYLYCTFTVLMFELCKSSCAYIGDKTGEYNTEQSQRQLVQYVVKLHTDAIKFLNDFKECFETTVLIVISTSMGGICMLIVQITSDTHLTAYFGLFVGAFQLLLYSYFGQMIITKRDEFAEAIYCSKWYELNDISTRKMVLLMLMNAQSCEGIKLKGFMELSLEAYCEMVKACYSFAAFLMNIM